MPRLIKILYSFAKHCTKLDNFPDDTKGVGFLDRVEQTRKMISKTTVF